MNEQVVDILREVWGAFQTRLHNMRAIEELALAPFQAQLLSIVGRYPAISQFELATSTRRDKAQVARAIKELERRGFIARSEHETDWRTQCLALTEEGHRASALIDRERAQLISEAFRECDTEELDALCHTLRKISRSVD